MVPPSPAASHLAACHGADGAANPNRGIDVNDPDTDDDNRSNRMDENRHTLLADARIAGEILIPDDEAARNQDHDQNRHRPENEFLAGIVLADLGKVLVMSSEYIADARQPGSILALPQVRLPEPDEKPQKSEEQNNADPGVKDACPRAAAEQPVEEEEAGMEQRKAGQGKKHETRRRDPVVDPRADRIAINRDGLARMDLVASLDIIRGHGGHPGQVLRRAPHLFP